MTRKIESDERNRTISDAELALFEEYLKFILRHWRASASVLASNLRVSRYSLYCYETRKRRPSFRVFEAVRIMRNKMHTDLRNEVRNG